MVKNLRMHFCVFLLIHIFQQQDILINEQKVNDVNTL